MNASSAKLETDTLFLACTRPAMIAGVTLEAMACNAMLTNLIFVMAGSLRYALIGIACHFVFRGLLKHDHNMFRVFMSYLNTKGRARNASHWGGSSMSPLPLVRTYSLKDFSLV